MATNFTLLAAAPSIWSVRGTPGRWVEVGGADGVQGGEGHRVAAQAGQGDRMPVLVDQVEVRGAAADVGRWSVDALGHDRIRLPVDRGGRHRDRTHEDGEEGPGRQRQPAGVPRVDRGPPGSGGGGGGGGGHGVGRLGRDLHAGGRPHHGQVAAGDEQQERRHGVGVGADAPEKAEVLDEDPVGQAEHDQHHHRGEHPRRRPDKKARPSSASATTTSRFTPQPWPRSNDANDETAEERTWGCGVPDIWAAIPASVPGFAVVPPARIPDRARPAARPSRGGRRRPTRSRSAPAGANRRGRGGRSTRRRRRRTAPRRGRRRGR